MPTIIGTSPSLGFFDQADCTENGQAHYGYQADQVQTILDALEKCPHYPLPLFSQILYPLSPDRKYCGPEREGSPDCATPRRVVVNQTTDHTTPLQLSQRLETCEITAAEKRGQDPVESLEGPTIGLLDGIGLGAEPSELALSRIALTADLVRDRDPADRH